MSNNIDLQTALGMFVDGTKSFAISQSLRQASEEVQKIKMSGIKETDQRLALGNVAQGLVAKMAGIGADAAQVEQARLNFTPKTFQSADQAILEGTLSGDQDLVTKGKQARTDQIQDDLALTREKAKIAANAQSAAFAQQDKRDERRLAQMMDIAKLKEKKSLSDAEIKNIHTFDTAEIQLKDLSNQIKEDSSLVGPIAGAVPGRGIISPKFAAFKQGVEQFFNAYRKDVTGAGVGEKELKMLRDAQPSITDPPDVFLARVEKTLNINKMIKSKYLNTLEKADRRVGAFIESAPREPATGVSPLASKYLK